VSRLLVFVEVPRFYAEVEASFEPLLRGQPFLVGGNPDKRGRVQSASAEAMSLGVEEGMLLIEALALCPDASIVRTNMRRYRDLSNRLRAFFRGRAERVELVGLAAAFLDFGVREEGSIQAAGMLVKEVREEFGFPVQIGLSPVKFIAMLAAREAGDGDIEVVSSRSLRKFLDPLSVTCLPGVGPRTEEKLMELGIVKVADVLSAPKETLLAVLGKQGASIYSSALGLDRDRIRSAPHARSLSQESTLREPQLDMLVLQELVVDLSNQLAHGLRLEGLSSQRVSLKASYEDGETITRTRTLKSPVASSEAIVEISEELLFRTDAGVRPLRLLGLALTELTRIGRSSPQLELF